MAPTRPLSVNPCCAASAGVTASSKQIASGRFGVTAEYLISGDEIEIKVAQGAKPGEGGQLMAPKIDAQIAKARYAPIGVDLIFLLGFQIPLTAAVMMLIGTLFGISFGWLSTGIVKLAAISLFSRGLVVAAYMLYGADQPAAAIALGIFGVLAPLWLFTSLFELDFFETLISLIVVGITLSLLQGLAIFVLLMWLLPALVK